MTIRRSMLAIVLVSVLNLPMITVQASDKDQQARCDHASPQSLTIKVILGDKDKPPMAEPENAVACFQDLIDFEIPGNKDTEFEIAFKDYSPFHKNLHGKGKTAPAKVNVEPKQETAYEYRILVPGYPAGDPFITIRPR